jgi:NADH dehydrogenase
LINSAKNVLGGFEEQLYSKTDKRLRDLDVIIKNDRKVVEVTQDSVKLSDGEVLDMDFMIFTGGIEPNGLVQNLALDKNEKGYIVSNSYLQSQNYAEVFAIGDCTTIYNNAKVVPPTADTAEQMAELCAKNINNLISNKPLIEHSINSRGVLIALGRGYAVARVFGFYMHGYSAYIMKKLIERVYAKKLNNRSKKGSKKIFSN